MTVLKRYTTPFYFIILIFFITSCEDVIDVDLEPGLGSLIVDAEILWFEGTSGNQQEIYLSRLTDYYQEETVKVSDARVQIFNSEGESFQFTETDEPGTYACKNFEPAMGAAYTLEILVNDDHYTATENLVASPAIKRIEQQENGGFLGEDLEVSIFYDDLAEEENFYLTDFDTEILQYPNFELTSDEFFNGNEIEENFSDEDLEPGAVVTINFRAISEQFYNYMNLILESTSANPFATPPASIRGNIINQTDPDRYAQGYFRLSQAHRIIYTME